MIVEYRVLGPLEVLLDGEQVDVPAGRGRVLLATLLLRPNEFVPVDELVDRVWDGHPPAIDRARQTLQMVVARLRQSLGAANCVRTGTRGYTAEVHDGQLDLTRFRRLTEQGAYREALALWRGPVLADVQSDSLRRDDVPPIEHERIVALERRIDADLAGVTDVLVPELRSLVRQHPDRETFWAQLMLALNQAGQQAEALAVYQEVRARLADELGVDPGARLREAHARVLAGEVPAAAEVPRQLPPAHPHFVGREQELETLTEMLRTRPGEPVVISALNGIGGVGKTALALQWAHQVAGRFPDGQLHVNLRGFDLDADPLDPFAVARDFLLALGVPEGDLPSAGPALIAEYRSALAGRRLLVLLDNARDVDQVRPLLPGGAGNLVLVTSRNRLSGLVVREGARPLAVEVLDDHAATVLLTARIGADRVAAEPQAVARLVERCAGLPLALGIVAARAAYGDLLTTLADELERERLDALDIEDPATAVRAVFSWSLRSVSETAAELFVLLGLHPGPDFGVEVAASLAGLPAARTRKALTELVGGSLLTAVPGGRYTRHDLLRDYAAERAGELPAGPRAEALSRMFGHYLHTTLAAHAILEPLVKWTPLVSPPEPAVSVPIADRSAATAWYDAEFQVLRGVVSSMVAAGEDDLAWRMGYMLHLDLFNRGRLGEAEATELVALGAATRRDDVFAMARLHRSLAGVLIARSDFARAEEQLSAALRCEELLNRPEGLSIVVRGLAYVRELQGRDAEALEVLLTLLPTLAERHVVEQATYQAALGRAYHRVGQDERGLELCRQADALFSGQDRSALADPVTKNRRTIGDILLKLDRPAEAIHHYEVAVEMSRTVRDLPYLAASLVELGTAHLAAGDRTSARAAFSEALSVYEDLGDEKAASVRERISSETNV
ncbi:AfsR/SARP family transcriptional regulator [Lentzea sp. NBRC 102530]|uniref:AfsR/SARP family transcriptional regulator n=1 Tax=Lentzea sp. NBRC 102530 TaxID=3032201 RepID=UPI0024A1B44F|nr:AfsR/SARP family transcriptional regulator [Lentzea sp. NBRC 102530]GLY52535.1 SARP family transcriptional regulator [Lentzea sp. NBRC 102530]